MKKQERLLSRSYFGLLFCQLGTNGKEEEGYLAMRLGTRALLSGSPARFQLELSFSWSELKFLLSIFDALCPQQEPTSK